jgi:hypothetical protein
LCVLARMHGVLPLATHNVEPGQQIRNQASRYASTNAIERAPIRDNRSPLRGSNYSKRVDLHYLVRGLSKDGRVMVDALFDIMRGVAPVGVEEKVSVSHVIQAAGMLLDRGFGKAVQTIITEDGNANPLDTLTLDQLATIRQALATPAPIVTIDIPPATH